MQNTIKELINQGVEIMFTNNGGDVHVRLIRSTTRAHWTHTIPAREWEYTAEQVLNDGLAELEKAEVAAKLKQ